MTPRTTEPRRLEIRKPGMPVLLRQLLWFAALWLAGLASVGTLAYIIRSVLM